MKIKKRRKPHVPDGAEQSGIYLRFENIVFGPFHLGTGVPKPRRSLPDGPDLRFFHQTVDVNGFTDDAGLFRAMDDSPMMLWAANPKTENVHANPVLVGYTGLSATEFLQMGWVEMVHPADRERTMRMAQEGFKTYQPVYHIYRYRGADGRYRWFLDYSLPRYYPDGRFAGYIGTMHGLLGPAARNPNLTGDPNEVGRELKVSEVRPAMVVVLQKPGRPMVSLWVVDVLDKLVHFLMCTDQTEVEFFARRMGPNLDYITDDTDEPMYIYEYLGKV